MVDEERDVNEEQIVPAPDVEEPAPSAETTQEPEETVEAPTEPVTPEEPEQQVPYDRFKSVNDEKNWYKQQLEAQLQKPSQPQQPQPQDPNTGLSPEEQVFYNNLDKRTKNIVSQAVKQKEDQYNKAIGKLQSMVGNVLTKQFRKDHPDIKPDSYEEKLIGDKLARGYDTEDAYKSVMFDKQKLTEQSKAKQKQQQLNQAKKQANVESSSTPANSGLPRKKENMRDTAGRLFDEEMSKGWDR